MGRKLQLDCGKDWHVWISGRAPSWLAMRAAMPASARCSLLCALQSASFACIMLGQPLFLPSSSRGAPLGLVGILQFPSLSAAFAAGCVFGSAISHA